MEEERVRRYRTTNGKQVLRERERVIAGKSERGGVKLKRNRKAGSLARERIHYKGCS